MEVDCAPGALAQVTAELDADPRVATIEYAARGCDLILTVVAASFEGMSQLLLDHLYAVPGIVSTRAHIAAQLHVEASRWRLDALDTDQLSALAALDRSDAWDGTPVDLTSPTYAPLVAGLGHDGRVSAAELAVQTGRPTSTVRRQLGILVRSRSLAFRCEVAQLLTRWPVCVTWWCRVRGNWARRRGQSTALRAARAPRHVADRAGELPGHDVDLDAA